MNFSPLLPCLKGFLDIKKKAGKMMTQYQAALIKRSTLTSNVGDNINKAFLESGMKLEFVFLMLTDLGEGVCS